MFDCFEMPQNKIGGWIFVNVILNFQAPNKRKLPDQGWVLFASQEWCAQ